METKIVNINAIKPNPDNPRLIKDSKYQKLVKSLKEFPEMLELREIIVDENMIILGGNMRYKALKELGIKDVPIKIASNLTEEQKKEFVIKDNSSFGEWDFDILANQFEEIDLIEWGVDISNWENEEIDMNDIDSNKNKINFEIKLSFENDKQLNEFSKILDLHKKDYNFYYSVHGGLM